MDILSLILKKYVQVWFLSTELYVEWQKVASHHRTPYLRTKFNHKAQDFHTLDFGLYLFWTIKITINDQYHHSNMNTT